MKKNSQPKASAFGQLVKEKLIEHEMSQAELGRRLSKGPAYMSYLISGRESQPRAGKFRPAQDVVERAARELGIPLDAALSAAGYDAPLAPKAGPPPDDPRRTKGEENKRKSTPKANADTDLFDIACQARAEALKKHAQGVATGASKTIKIDLDGRVHMTLSGLGAELSDDDIARYTLAFRIAYGSVQPGEANRKS